VERKVGRIELRLSGLPLTQFQLARRICLAYGWLDAWLRWLLRHQQAAVVVFSPSDWLGLRAIIPVRLHRSLGSAWPCTSQRAPPVTYGPEERKRSRSIVS
jgi:hypothetical protein